MQNLDHALQVLGEKLQLPALQFNAEGHCEIVLADDLSVFVTRLELAVAEISFRLPDLDVPDDRMMRALLEANCLGSGTGSGRLAVDTHGHVIYCDRWDVQEMNATALEARLSVFLQYATHWRTEGGQALLDQVSRGDEATLTDLESDGFLIRA